MGLFVIDDVMTTVVGFQREAVTLPRYRSPVRTRFPAPIFSLKRRHHAAYRAALFILCSKFALGLLWDYNFLTQLNQ